jgi:ribosome-binding protein aMBF1 (putative translation factor)
MAATRAPLTWVPDEKTGAQVGYEIDTEVLNDTMERRGINRSQLATRCETSRGYISDICNGNRQPGPALLQSIAQALGIHYRALILRVVTVHSDAKTPTGSAA